MCRRDGEKLHRRLGCELRRNKNVSDRNFGCYGIFMFRTVISGVSGTELIEKLPRKGGVTPDPKQQIKEIRHIAPHLALRFSTQPARL